MKGKLFVNFVGHGFTTGWSAQSSPPLIYITTANVSELTNAGKFPIILAMTCWEGYYINPKPLGTEEAFAEVITKADNRGAVASWSPTGLGDATTHDYLNRSFYTSIFEGGVRILGDATLAGKLALWASGSNLDLLDTYLLFGDPATRIALAFTAINDTYAIDEDGLLTVPANIGVLENDIHPQNSSLNAVLVENVSNGVVALAADGSFTYMPDPDFNGTDSFTYQANDGVEDSNIATVTISVNPVNDPPVAYNQTVSTLMNIPLNIILIATDDDGGSPSLLIQQVFLQSETGYLQDSDLTFAILTQPAYGMLSGTAPDLVYTPNLDYFGSDSFTFIANDGEYDSNVATVTIQVQPAYLGYAPLVSR